MEKTSENQFHTRNDCQRPLKSVLMGSEFKMEVWQSIATRFSDLYVFLTQTQGGTLKKDPKAA